MALKQQKFPSSVIKVGAVLFQVTAYYHDGKTCVDVDEWHVKSIRKRRGSQTKNGFNVPVYLRNDQVYVNLIAKIEGVTWVRLSRKVGDIGWSPSIPANFRKQFAVGQELPLGIYTTKLQAFKYALESSIKYISNLNIRLESELNTVDREEYEQELHEEQLILKTLKSHITRLNNKSKLKK